jgi:hypothetical protein
VTFNKEGLFESRLKEADVDVPGVGVMRIRELSRAEVIDRLWEVDRTVRGAFETRLVSMSLVDPVLTEEEVQRWRTISTHGEIEAVLAKINELSMLTKESAKEAYKEFESNPDASFRDVPGEGAVDDGGASEG